MKWINTKLAKHSSRRVDNLMVFCMTLFLCVNGVTTKAQETMHWGLKNEVTRADLYYNSREFKHALDLYVDAQERGKATRNTMLQIARCYYALNDYEHCVTWYAKHLTEAEALQPADMLNYAEALRSTKHYNQAIKWYNDYVTINSDDGIIRSKIWRLKNIKYLYDDSAYFAIRPLNINSTDGELGAVIVQDGLIFMSNHKTINITQQSTGDDMPFYKLYYSKVIKDSLTGLGYSYERPVIYFKSLHSKYHEGPVAFYDNYNKMIYTTISNPGKDNNPNHVLQLYFAEKQDKKWSITTPFPFNSNDYSISQPSISDDGNTLYFSSDKKGGYGKRDLYKSINTNGQWSEPVNLGNQINTAEDETFPYIHNQTTLYFSSNGQAGFGGFDIHKVEITGNRVGEIQNMGYPINTNFDDFSINLNNDGTHGYFSSNRKNGGLDDDIYELDINLQSYPLLLSGLLKYKMSNWKDSIALKTLPLAKLYVIDNVKEVVVSTGTSDEKGYFTISIPYFSRYRIRVIELDGSETMVSLDLSKQHRKDNHHEIVIVKDVFKLWSGK